MPKLEFLTVENFRGHENLTLQLGPVTICTGGNGSGKSSIKDALVWLASGRCSVTNERGTGPIVRNGSNRCSVTAELPGGGTVSRTSGGGLCCSWAPGAKQPEVALAAWMGCEGNQARLVLEAGRFFSLKPGDRKELLFDLLDLNTTPEAMVSHLGVMHGAEVRDCALKIVGANNLGNLEMAYDRCDKARTVCNRNIKELTAHLKQSQEEQGSQDLIYMPEDELQKLLDQEKALLKEERQLHWDARVYQPDHIEEQKAALLETRQRTNCPACGQRLQDTAEKQDAAAALMCEIAELEAEAPEKLAKIDAKRAEILQKVAEIREKREAGSKYRESASNLNNIRERLANATKEAEKLKVLLEVYGSGPTSVLHMQIRPRIGAWEEAVNAVSRRWGLSCRYNATLTLEVNRQGDWVAYEALSDGEQLLVSLAHQVALAQKFGLRMVCLDRIEALDSGNQARLIEKAFDLTQSGELDHVLLMGVRLDAELSGQTPGLVHHDLRAMQTAVVA